MNCVFCNNPFVRAAALLLAAAIAVASWRVVASRFDSGGTRSINGFTMGTTYRVLLVGCTAAERDALERDADALLSRLSGCMTVYDPNSETSVFNADRDVSAARAVSADLADIVRLSIGFSRDTRGCFDITVSPLVELWGFGGKGLPKARPSDEDIRKTLSEIGIGQISVDGQGRLRKKLPGAGIDLGAVAQGYGADRVAALVDSRGIKNYLVDVGGEIFCRGANESGGPWRIGIEKPSLGQSSDKAVNAVMAVSGVAVATSGSYRNYYIDHEHRYTHIIDPRTGMPVEHGMLSVTVVAPAAAQADAYATALMVMGPDEGYDWAVGREGVEAFFVYVDSNGRTAEKATPGLPVIEKRPDA